MAQIKGTNKLGITNLFEGGVDDDHIVATNDNDTIYGGAGNDHINALNGDDNIYGGIGDDLINAGAGDDQVTGGAGDDYLTGNGGADVFHYSFNVSTGSTTIPVCSFIDLDQDGKLTQEEFVHQYDAWLAQLGVDTDANGIVAVDNANGAADELPTVEGFEGTFGEKDTIIVQTGNTSHTRHYVSSATMDGVETVTTSDGHDTIADFHVGLDSLDLGDLTLAQFLSHFAADDSADVNGDLVNDTVITIAGDTTFSITLLGVSGYDLADFYG